MLMPVPSDKDLGSLGPDGMELAQWSKSAKSALRQKLRALRQALPEASAAARSTRIVERLIRHPKILEAKGVALFWPMLERREIDLRPLDSHLRVRGVDLYYPFMDQSDHTTIATGFRLVASVEELAAREQRFAEPSPAARIAERGDINVVVVPALAATLDGHRLGYGAGFYDATLLDVCPPASSIVVVYDFQLMFELPVEPHDTACDDVVTDREDR